MVKVIRSFIPGSHCRKLGQFPQNFEFDYAVSCVRTLGTIKSKSRRLEFDAEVLASLEVRWLDKEGSGGIMTEER